MANENELMMVDNVPNVDIAKKQWDAYQELCKGILDETDYQKILVKEKDENGNYVEVERQFKKKTAWQKLSRAFNVDTRIVEKEFQRTKTGRINEAYYCVRATLPNGRSVESDALCSRTEKGKSKVSDHTIMATAKTRATNRAISELIGAGEVSSDEMTAEYKASDDPDHHYISHKQHAEIPEDTIDVDPVKAAEDTVDAIFKTADEIGESDPKDDPVRNQCQQIKLMLERDGKLVNKVSMKMKVFQLIEDEVIPAENENALIDFIVKHCPEELD